MNISLAQGSRRPAGLLRQNASMVQLSSGPGAPVPRHREDPVSRLAGRIAGAGAGPLLTWYCDDARVELSTRTVGTWVAKTVHLMAEEGVGAGDLVHLTVLRQRPMHWVSCCWLLACWWSGARPSVRPEDAGSSALAVCGPDPSGTDPDVPLVQCSLQPLAGPCQNPVPGAIDFVEALAMPDEMPAASPAAGSRHWLEDSQPLTGNNLAGAEPVSDALLVAATDGPGPAPRRIARLLAGCLIGGGSLILVESRPTGLTVDELAAQERARVGQ